MCSSLNGVASGQAPQPLADVANEPIAPKQQDAAVFPDDGAVLHRVVVGL